MKNTIKIFTVLFVMTAMFVFVPTASAVKPTIINGVTNGGFETGDYTGWTTWHDYPEYQTWGIADGETTINQYDIIKSFIDETQFELKEQVSPALPITFIPAEGQFMSFHLSNGEGNGGRFGMYQDITLPQNATTLSWSMFYNSDSRGGFSDIHFISVTIQDLDGSVGDPAVPFFITNPEDLTSLPMTEMVHDISAYADANIRIVIEGDNRSGSLDVGFDDFSIAVAQEPEEPTVPPGWNQGEKKGWDGGSTPPGLNKNDKTPPGFENENGARTGWKKISIPSGI